MALTAPAGALLGVLAPTAQEAAFHVTANEWYFVLASAASAAGVYAVSNRK